MPRGLGLLFWPLWWWSWLLRVQGPALAEATPCHVLVPEVVICLPALWGHLLGCVSLSCRGVASARDPASSQVKDSFLDQLSTLRALVSGGAGPAMAFRRTEGMSVIQALAMTVAEIPVFLYTTFGQVQPLNPGSLGVLESRACSLPLGCADSVYNGG